LLDTYSTERGAVGDMVLHNAGLFTRVAMIRNPALQYLRNHLIGFATQFTAVQQRAIANLTEMAVHYPKSPLNGEDPGPAWRGGIYAGDRLPDAELLHPKTSQTTRLLSAISNSQHTLLLLSADPAALAALLPEAQSVASAFGPSVQILSILFQPLTSQTSDQDAVLPDNNILFDSQNELRDRLGLRATAIAVIRPDGYLAFRGHATSLPKLEAHLKSFLTPG
jgi:hypothetical protein